ncbi:MAG: DUF4340 domain-containing protein [Deltaproteobacteria bacterium]|nr:DUF4340 domain-containing protein [Candidatus Anaeroferrophillacea bacterium]
MREYVVLAVVIVGLGVYLAVRNTDRTHYELPKPAALDTAKVDRLTVERPDGTLELVRRDGRWLIRPEDQPADPGRVGDMIGELAQPHLTAMVSEAGDYRRYDLDSGHRIRVTARTGDEVQRELDIGKAAGTYQHTYVRLAGDNNVYHARGSLRRVFDRTAEALRDKTVLTFAVKSIEMVTVQVGKKTRVLRRLPAVVAAGGGAETGTESGVKGSVATADAGALAGQGAATAGDDAAGQENVPAGAEESSAGVAPTARAGDWQADDGEIVAAVDVDKVLANFSMLECRRYLDDAERKTMTTAGEWSLTFADGARAHTITFHAKPAKDFSGVPAVSSDVDDAFAFADDRAGQLREVTDRLLGSATTVTGD